MPEDLKVSQIGSSQLPPLFRGLHSPGVRKHCQIIFACYFRKSSIRFYVTWRSPTTRSLQRLIAMHQQNCQPWHFGRSLLRLRAPHYTPTLMIISLHSSPEKKEKKKKIWCVHVGIKCTSNRLTNCRVQFSSCSFASFPGEKTSVFYLFKSPRWSKKLKRIYQVINLIKKKNAHWTFWGE